MKFNSLCEVLMVVVFYLVVYFDVLYVFVDEGNVVGIGVWIFGFEYWYMLMLIVIDYLNSFDIIVVFVLVWLCINQFDVFINLDKWEDVFKFEVEILNYIMVDILIKLKLIEWVIVKVDGKGYQVEYYLELINEYDDFVMWRFV